MSRLSAILFVLIATLVLGGCQQSRSKGLFNRFFEPKPLRVGMTLDAPPLTFRKDNVAAGLEMQFASGLASFIERPLEIVEVPRDGMAKALLDKKVDILMTGMTVDDAHSQKLATSNPYFLSGQVALVHLDDFQMYGTGTRHLTAKNARLGVVGDSSGDTLLKGLAPKGKITRYPSASEAVKALLADTIDVTGHQMTSQSIREAQGLLEVYWPRGIQADRARERFGRHVDTKAIVLFIDNGQTNATAGYRIAVHDVVESETSRIDGQAQRRRSIVTRNERSDLPDGSNDSGEHIEDQSDGVNGGNGF